jgi:hypothetical protein
MKRILFALRVARAVVVDALKPMLFLAVHLLLGSVAAIVGLRLGADYGTALAIGIITVVLTAFCRAVWQIEVGGMWSHYLASKRRQVMIEHPGEPALKEDRDVLLRPVGGEGR